MVSEKDTSECLQLCEQELEMDKSTVFGTCGRAVHGGGGGGGASGGGGGGGGTGMPRSQIPVTDNAHTVTQLPSFSHSVATDSSSFLFSSMLEAATV